MVGMAGVRLVKGKRCYSNKIMAILSTQLPLQVAPSQKAQIFLLIVISKHLGYPVL